MNDKTLQIKFKNSKFIIVNTYNGRLLARTIASSLYCRVHQWLGQAKSIFPILNNVLGIMPKFGIYALPCIVSQWYYGPMRV